EGGPGGTARTGRGRRGDEQHGEQWLDETRVHATFSWSSRSFAYGAQDDRLAPRGVSSEGSVSSRAPGSSRPARRAARDGWRAGPGSPGSSSPPAASTTPRRARTPAGTPG